MSKKNRERKSHNRERLRDLGIADSNLSRAQKRQLMRDMSSVPTLVEIREEVADYSAASIIAGLGSQKTLEPFVVSRLVHEAAQSAGATPISADQLRVLGSGRRPPLGRRDQILLAAASRLLPRELWRCFPVSPQTVLRWHRDLVRRKWTYADKRQPGRPRIANDVATLVLRLAKENPR